MAIKLFECPDYYQIGVKETISLDHPQVATAMQKAKWKFLEPQVTIQRLDEIKECLTTTLRVFNSSRADYTVYYSRHKKELGTVDNENDFLLVRFVTNDGLSLLKALAYVEDGWEQMSVQQSLLLYLFLQLEQQPDISLQEAQAVVQDLFKVFISDMALLHTLIMLVGQNKLRAKYKKPQTEQRWLLTRKGRMEAEKLASIHNNSYFK